MQGSNRYERSQTMLIAPGESCFIEHLFESVVFSALEGR